MKALSKYVFYPCFVYFCFFSLAVPRRAVAGFAATAKDVLAVPENPPYYCDVSRINRRYKFSWGKNSTDLRYDGAVGPLEKVKGVKGCLRP